MSSYSGFYAGSPILVKSIDTDGLSPITHASCPDDIMVLIPPSLFYTSVRPGLRNTKAAKEVKGGSITLIE